MSALGCGVDIGSTNVKVTLVDDRALPRFSGRQCDDGRFLVGFGELVAYALRSFSGYLADRSRKYWLFVFLGYAVNMFAFLGGLTPAVIGMVTWGIGMGAQDSLLKAVLTNVVPVEEPSTALWVFDTGFNIAWFVGSAAMGWLYDRSVPALVCFSFALQVAALPVLFFARRLGAPRPSASRSRLAPTQTPRYARHVFACGLSSPFESVECHFREKLAAKIPAADRRSRS